MTVASFPMLTTLHSHRRVMRLPLSQYYDDHIAESKTTNGMDEKEAESDTDMSSISSE